MNLEHIDVTGQLLNFDPQHAEDLQGLPGRVAVSITVRVPGEDVPVVAFTVGLGSTDRPYHAASHAIDCVAADVTRGWAGIGNPEGWNETAKAYDRPGTANVVMLVTAVHAKSLEKNVSTTGSLVRAICHTVRAVAGDAEAWVQSTRKASTGAKW